MERNLTDQFLFSQDINATDINTTYILVAKNDLNEVLNRSV